MTQSVSPPRPETSAPEQDTQPLPVSPPRGVAGELPIRGLPPGTGRSNESGVWLVPATILAAIGTGTVIRLYLVTEADRSAFALIALAAVLGLCLGALVCDLLIGGRDGAGRD